MTCSSWIGACWRLGHLTRCVCVDEPGHAGACVCPCGRDKPVGRCSDCDGDPCPCGRPGRPLRPAEAIVALYPDRATSVDRRRPAGAPTARISPS